MSCKAIDERRSLTFAIAEACIPAGTADRSQKALDMIEPVIQTGEFGSEKGMLVIFSVLHSIVNEYLQGGDQLAEACTCGIHR